MGLSFSKHQRHDNIDDTKRIVTEIQEKVDLERQQLLEKYGILIPPAFGVTGTPSQKGLGLPISIQHRLLSISSSKKKMKIQAKTKGVQEFFSTTPLRSRPISYIDYLHETDLSRCVLHDHIQGTGIWISAQPAKHTNIRCCCILPPPPPPTTTIDSSSSSSSSTPKSQLFVERRYVNDSSRYGRGAVLQLRAEADSASTASSEPSLSSSIQLTKELSFFASINTSGIGWIGSHWDHTFANILLVPRRDENDNKVEESAGTATTATITSSTTTPTNNTSLLEKKHTVYEGLDTMNRNNVNVKLGAWIPIEWNSSKNSNAGTNHSNNAASRLLSMQRSYNNNKQVHGYAAINMLGATAAVHASLPVDSCHWESVLSDDHNTQQFLQTRTYVSANLNDEDRPPLQITLERDSCDDDGNAVANISLTQVFTFDRYQINPIDNRAPKIRNTMAWTARLTTTTTDGSSSSETYPVSDPIRVNDSSSSESERATTTSMSLGLAWQVNRSIAFKTVVRPQNASMTTAVLFKRWKQPRITCSLMKTWQGGGGGVGSSSTSSSSSSSITSGWGFGIELEAGDYSSYSSNPESYYYNHHPNLVTSIYGGDADEGYPRTKATLPTDIGIRNSKL